MIGNVDAVDDAGYGDAAVVAAGVVTPRLLQLPPAALAGAPEVWPWALAAQHQLAVDFLRAFSSPRLVVPRLLRTTSSTSTFDDIFAATSFDGKR